MLYVYIFVGKRKEYPSIHSWISFTVIQIKENINKNDLKAQMTIT